MADASEPSRPAQAATSSTSSSHDLEVWYEFVSDKQSAVAVTLRELLQRDPSDTASTMVYRRGHSEEWQPLGEALSSRSSVQSRPQFSQRESGELPANFQRGVNVTVDPTTGGLVGLPESWAGVVPGDPDVHGTCVGGHAQPGLSPPGVLMSVHVLRVRSIFVR